MVERGTHTLTNQSAGLGCREQRGAGCGGDQGFTAPGRWRATDAPGTVSLVPQTSEPRSMDGHLCWFQLVWRGPGWRPGSGTSEAGWFAVVVLVETPFCLIDESVSFRGSMCSLHLSVSVCM